MDKLQVWRQEPFQELSSNSTGLLESCPNLDFSRAAQQLCMNGSDIIDDHGKASVIKLPDWKTVFCRRLGTSEGCMWGQNCHFAHTQGELRAGAARIRKTAVQKFDAELKRKGLPNSDQLVANIGDQGLKTYKSKLCMYHEKGTCVLGVWCSYAHGEGELRSISAPSSSSENQDDWSLLKKVFVGGLPLFVNSGELKSFCEKEFGKVAHAKVIIGDDQGRLRSRGFGFVRFEQQKDADEAVKRRHLQLKGKIVEVKRVAACMDSTSGNEVEDFSPSFSSGISSPAIPLRYSPFASMDVDSPSGDDADNSLPLFSSGMSSPGDPLHSPPSSEPRIGLVKDIALLPTLFMTPWTGPQPGRSVSSLPVEAPQGELLYLSNGGVPYARNPDKHWSYFTWSFPESSIAQSEPAQ